MNCFGKGSNNWSLYEYSVHKVLKATAFICLMICMSFFQLGCEDTGSSRAKGKKHYVTKDTAATFFIDTYLMRMPVKVSYGKTSNGGMRLYPPKKQYFADYKGMGLQAKLDVENNSYVLRNRYDEVVEQQFAIDARNKNINWVTIGVNGGDKYMNAKELQNYFYYTFIYEMKRDVEYEKLADKAWELDVYALQGIDPKTNLPHREGYFAEDIFVYRNKTSNLVRSFIKCGNRKSVRRMCSHFFNLSPLANIGIEIIYPRQFLPHWRENEQLVRQIFIDAHEQAIQSIEEKENATINVNCSVDAPEYDTNDCRATFLFAQGGHLLVYARFNSKYLADWKNIQKAVRQYITSITYRYLQDT